METNAFMGKSEPPTEADLSAALGKAKKLWDEVLSAVAEIAPVQEWNSYSIKAGWSMKLKNKERTILYLSPGKRSLRASFALGEKAVKAARTSGLPKAVLKVIGEAKKYAEGTAVRVEVCNKPDIEVVKKLAAIKLAN
jgi:hypothetical protein